MAQAKLAKCWSCKQTRSLEWGKRTLCGTCGHQLVLRRGRCDCNKCRGERADHNQLEMFDQQTGKALVPAKPTRGRKAEAEGGAVNE